MKGDEGDDDPEESLPLRKCGLKLSGDAGILRTGYVTSLAEVWIEIGATGDDLQKLTGHFPCGSVD